MSDRCDLAHTRHTPAWKPDLRVEPPAWMVVGVRVSHDTFRPRNSRTRGTYSDVPSVWVNLDDGQTKGLALEFALPRMRPVPARTTERKHGLGGRDGR